MAWVQTVAPTAEPVTALELAQQLLLPEDEAKAQSTYIADLIAEAREYAEDRLGQQLVTATWQLTLDGFPRHDPIRDRTNASWLEAVTIRPPKPPLRSITSVQYLDPAGVLQTWSSSLYVVDTANRPGRIMPAFGQIWPFTLPTANAVTITYVAGYGDPKAVPRKIKKAIKLLAAHWYENREATAGAAPVEIPLGVNALLDMAWHGEYI